MKQFCKDYYVRYGHFSAEPKEATPESFCKLVSWVPKATTKSFFHQHKTFKIIDIFNCKGALKFLICYKREKQPTIFSLSKCNSSTKVDSIY